jgi:hypothetical protein
MAVRMISVDSLLALGMVRAIILSVIKPGIMKRIITTTALMDWGIYIFRWK